MGKGRGKRRARSQWNNKSEKELGGAWGDSEVVVVVGGCFQQGDAMTIIGKRGNDVKVGPCSCQLSILLLAVPDSKYLVSIQPQTWL